MCRMNKSCVTNTDNFNIMTEQNCVFPSRYKGINITMGLVLPVRQRKVAFIVTTTRTWNLITASLFQVKIQDKIIHILELKGWQSNEMLPPSASVMLELWQETERLYSGKEPIVVTCLWVNGCFFVLGTARNLGRGWGGGGAHLLTGMFRIL